MLSSNFRLWGVLAQSWLEIVSRLRQCSAKVSSKFAILTVFWHDVVFLGVQSQDGAESAEHEPRWRAYLGIMLLILGACLRQVGRRWHLQWHPRLDLFAFFLFVRFIVFLSLRSWRHLGLRWPKIAPEWVPS